MELTLGNDFPKKARWRAYRAGWESQPQGEFSLQTRCRYSEGGSPIQFMIVARGRGGTRSFSRCVRTRRELAAALLFDVAGPDRSKAPGTTLMF